LPSVVTVFHLFLLETTDTSVLFRKDITPPKQTTYQGGIDFLFPLLCTRLLLHNIILKLYEGQKEGLLTMAIVLAAA